MNPLNERRTFPPVTDRTPDLVSRGGPLTPERLLEAYSLGIFPWYGEDDPFVLWWSPRRRFVLRPENLHIPKSLRRRLFKKTFTLRFDTAFPEVIHHCRTVPRKGQNGTWITDEMEENYTRLHRAGYAHSVEYRENGTLLGGLYGLNLGNIFFGESMFSLTPESSRKTFVIFTLYLRSKGFALIDCQQETEHLRRFGAEPIPRKTFEGILRTGLFPPGLYRGNWDELFRDFPRFPEALRRSKKTGAPAISSSSSSPSVPPPASGNNPDPEPGPNPKSPPPDHPHR